MTEIVGILNVTPDSFSDGGEFQEVELAMKRVDEMFREGADMIDIGAESTRPGGLPVSPDEEWTRLESLLTRLKEHYSAHRFSIDTRHGSVAEQVVKWWSPEITINDVTGLSSPAMVKFVAANGLKVIVGHLPPGSGESVAAAHTQKMTDKWEVRDQLITRYLQLVAGGVKEDKIIIDPGIGFGKSPELNRELVEFSAIAQGIPTMIGYSRKKFMGEKRYDPKTNAVLGERAIRAGARYLRVHDVASHHQMRQTVYQSCL